jgi:hypothetical protein
MPGAAIAGSGGDSAAELLHAGFEDSRQRPGIGLGGGDVLVQRIQFGAAPELALERVGRRLRGPDHEPLAKDDRPGCQRDQHQQQHHYLHQQAGIGDERQDREVV